MVQLEHRDLGGVGNLPLIILHGMLGSARNWQTVGADLATRYHVLALDLRNHGRSPHADSMSYSEMMEDVLGWMDNRAMSHATLLGHSMGGKTAMLLACRHPKRVERLVVVDIAPKDYYWVAHRRNFAAMNELNLQDVHSRAEAELRLESRVQNWALRKFLTTNLEQAPGGKWRWQINLPVITASLSALERNSLDQRDHYDGPVRFIRGATSDYIEPSDEPTILSHFRQADIVTIPGAGHNPHMETREPFVRAVLA